jgi:hypothetical protein
MNLKKQKLKLIDKIRSLDNAIKGSVYEMKRFCGKPNCACAKTNTPHASLVLSFSYKGKTRLIPIKKEQIPKIKARIADYRELKAAIDELTRINAELLRSEE